MGTSNRVAEAAFGRTIAAPLPAQPELVQFTRPYREVVDNHARFRFTQLHIEVARNATGDFNPFHDALKWQSIRNNRFGAPIVLGFQLEMLLAHAVDQQRRMAPPAEMPADVVCRYASFRFTFADVVKVGDPVEVEVKPARWSRRQGGTLGNRVFLRKEGRTAVAGRVECSCARPEALGPGFRPPAGLSELPDRSWLAGNRYFLKHRVLQSSDAKNFLAGSQIAPHHYFDDLEGRARFPALFPLALVSSALLERAASEGYDFIANPLVYASHNLHIDLQRLDALHDGQLLHLLVEGPLPKGRDQGSRRYRCFGLLSAGRLLFTAEIKLSPLLEAPA
jgi:acyl dehydratase